MPRLKPLLHQVGFLCLVALSLAPRPLEAATATPSVTLRDLLEGKATNSFRMDSGWGTRQQNVTLLHKLSDDEDWDHYTRGIFIPGSPLRVLTTSWNGFVNMHAVDNGRRLWRKQLATGVISGVALLADGASALIPTSVGDVLLIDLASGEVRHTYRQISPAKRITALAVAPAGDVFAIGDVEGAVKVVSLGSGLVGATMPKHAWPIMAVSFSRRDGFLYAADPTSIATYHWPSEERRLQVTAPDGPGPDARRFWFTSAAFSPLEDRVFVGSYDRALGINLVTSELRHEFPGHDAGIVQVKLYDDDTKLLTVSRDLRLRIFEVETGVMEHEIFMSRSWIAAISDAAVDLTTGHIALTTYEANLLRMRSYPSLRLFSYTP